MLKKVAIALGVLLLLAAVTLGWLWHQATALPEWYTEGSLEELAGPPEGAEGPIAPPQWIAFDDRGDRLPTEPAEPFPELEAEPLRGAGVEAASPETSVAPRPRRHRAPEGAKRHELRGFHVRRGKDGKRKGSPAIRASRAVYEDGALEIGVILDLGRLPKDELKPRERERYERAVRRFPGLTKRDVWVGVEDRPISVGGYLQLSPEAEVRVGKLTYSLASAAERLGMSPVELRLELNRSLRRLGFVDPEA